MTRKKRSVIWKISKEEMEIIVNKAKTFSEVLNHFGLSNKGGNNNTLKARLNFDNIDFSHIPTGLNANKGIARGGLVAIPLKEILVENSSYNRNHLKKRLIKSGLLEYKCFTCSLVDWNGEYVSLQLEHINGVSNDNRLENLCLLCPNCHSQTLTFAGKSNKVVYSCSGCGGSKKSKTSKLCNTCNALTRRKTNRPSLDVLNKQVLDHGYIKTGKLYSVSDTTIRKWLKAV